MRRSRRRGRASISVIVPGLQSPDLRALPVRAAGRENILVDADLGADRFLGQRATGSINLRYRRLVGAGLGPLARPGAAAAEQRRRRERAGYPRHPAAFLRFAQRRGAPRAVRGLRASRRCSPCTTPRSPRSCASSLGMSAFSGPSGRSRGKERPATGSASAPGWNYRAFTSLSPARSDRPVGSAAASRGQPGSRRSSVIAFR